MVTSINDNKIGISNTEYDRRMGVELPTYVERIRVIIKCPECSKEILHTSLKRHMIQVHHKLWKPEDDGIVKKNQLEDSQTFQITADQTTCPRFQIELKNNNGLRKHFRGFHPKENLIGTDHVLAQCRMCGIFLIDRI